MRSKKVGLVSFSSKILIWQKSGSRQFSVANAHMTKNGFSRQFSVAKMLIWQKRKEMIFPRHTFEKMTHRQRYFSKKVTIYGGKISIQKMHIDTLFRKKPMPIRDIKKTSYAVCGKDTLWKKTFLQLGRKIHKKEAHVSLYGKKYSHDKKEISLGQHIFFFAKKAM